MTPPKPAKRARFIDPTAFAAADKIVERSGANFAPVATQHDSAQPVATQRESTQLAPTVADEPLAHRSSDTTQPTSARPTPTQPDAPQLASTRANSTQLAATHVDASPPAPSGSAASPGASPRPAVSHGDPQGRPRGTSRVRLQAYVSQATADAIVALAAKDDRSESYMLNQLIVEGLKARGVAVE